MVSLTDMKQISYLQLKGVNFKNFTREGNKKVFHYEQTQEEIDRLISEFYASDISRYIGCYEEMKTLVYRT